MESGEELPDRPKKKRCTKVSKVEKSLPEGTKRRSTLSLSLEAHLTDTGKLRIDVLESIAKRTGFYRRLTSLLSNYIVARRIEQRLDLPEINKKFYDQVWSSLTGKENEWFPLREEFIQYCNFRTEEFPGDVKTRTKESVTNEMSTVAKTMITQMFEPKLKSHVKKTLNDESQHFSGLEWKEKERDTNLVVRHVMDIGFTTNQYLDIHGEYGRIIRILRSTMTKAYGESLNTGKKLLQVLKIKPHLFLKTLSYINIEAEIKSNELLMEDRPYRVKVSVSSLLPVFELQPAFVYYSDSVVKAEFPGYEFTRFVSENFRCDKFNLNGYEVYGFRTNGIELHLSLMVPECQKPYPSGTKDLDKAGYKIVTAKVDVLEQKRGLFKMYQTKTDAKRVLDPTRVKIKSVDPGCSSVVSVREIYLENCSDPRDVVGDESSITWDLLGTEYSKTSGRNSGQTRETRRRRKCLSYRRAMDRFKGVRRKTSCAQSILDYCKVVASTLKDLYREKNRRNRRVFRMYQTRRTRSTIDKLSNKIAFDKDDRKNVVLFGNGSFKAKKGHASCPRKVLVRSLASRVLVGILDEYRTSKRCPGGCGGEMEDIEENRMRRCTTDLCDSSCILSSGSGGENDDAEEDNFSCDRDRSATINFCRIGYESLVNCTWPSHLVRSQGC